MALKEYCDQDQKIAILVEFGNPPIWSVFFTADNGKGKEVQFHSKEQAESYARRNNYRIIFTEHRPNAE